MTQHYKFSGLTDQEVEAARKLYGKNITEKATGIFWPVLRDIVTEPMFILLVATAGIYFLLGETNEGFFMVAAIVMVSAISFFQDQRSRKALKALKNLTQTQAKVLRNGAVVEIAREEIVKGDFVVVEEGMMIPADGIVRQCNDFTVNESILTGESFTVTKDPADDHNNIVYEGTTVSSGAVVFEVTAIGVATRFGKIGKSLLAIKEQKTPLQQQIETFVKRMAITGILVFLLIWVYDFIQSHNVLKSLLKGLTLAMSILPEEIPVAFTTFMAMGAWRLMKRGIIVKQIKTVETLGSATVVCADKTGTLTENQMTLAVVYAHATKNTFHSTEWNTPQVKQVIETAMWASEPAPFDPMEKALHGVYSKLTTVDKRPTAKMVQEYPLSGKPPVMTHIFKISENEEIIAAKGAPETILRQSSLFADEKQQITQEWQTLARQGYRVLAVAVASHRGSSYPKSQTEFLFHFLGLIAFYDPPKKNIASVLNDFYEAGIEVKIITGDNEITTSAIADQIKLRRPSVTIDGNRLMAMNDDLLKKTVSETNVFTRMFPDAKLRVINALKDLHHIVAMTGDGVNDAPALKAAHIGIAMGKRGSEIAKQAAALVLVEDDLHKMVEAVAMGRKIYGNLKKAIQYIISIHIPIILTVALPLFLGWIYPHIFSPVHVIFLELIMGPTCSIVYENEPPEKNSMQQPPRKMTTNFLQWHELRISILQGVGITAATLSSYQYSVAQGWTEEVTRSMVFTTLIVANIFLTLANRSFYHSILTAIAYKNILIPVVIGVTVTLLLAIVYVPALNDFFQMKPLAIGQGLWCVVTGFLSVTWFEVYKYFRRISSKTSAIITP